MRVTDDFSVVFRDSEHFSSEVFRIAHRAVASRGAAHLVLPQQFYDHGPDHCPPCKLHRALLVDAVEQFLLTRRPTRNPCIARERQRHHGELLAWFAGADAPIAFATCAELVGRQPNELRRRILALVDHQPPKHHHRQSRRRYQPLHAA